jgi:predicted ATPase/class 3 adenylate cyclase
MTETLSFGYWVRRRRKALDLTQAELAERVGCAEVTIRRIEADERRPSRQIAALLADHLQLDPQERSAFLQAARAELAPDRLGLTTAPRNMPAPEVAPAAVPPVPAPTGTVTFLFTDIEGSTRLWEQHPQAMSAALARHDTLLREAIAAHAGTIFKTVGDAVCAAFPTAPDALAAALDAQQALQAATWVETGSLPVRMALHTGNPETRGDDYVGPPLNRVARLLASGHGGQVLLSAATWELVRDQLPAGASLRDLGEHRLKDLAHPEQIFQVAAPGLPGEFPPLKTLDAYPTNLPLQPTALIGREREVETICDLLRQPEARLLTLTGPGGIGKTRLALQAATELLDSLKDGVWFVGLAPISDPDLVPTAIAQVLGIRESGNRTMLDMLKAYLRAKELLLLLDNFEQVGAAASVVADLLAAAPRLKVLVSSREVLHLYGEREYAVPPLALPERTPLPSVERLTQNEAVRLFIERAQAVKADFTLTNDNAPAIAEVCHRLDGLPLAIELAAARSKILSPQAILARLDRRLQMLTGGARNQPARQQTLRGAIDWSYNLLDAGEQELFARLGVFVGGCTVEAAEQVCAAGGDLLLDVFEGLVSLVDKSLLRQVEGTDGEPRFVMLETIREYALERLEQSGEVAAIGRQHATYCLTLAEHSQVELAGTEQEAWLLRLEAEYDNLRAALAWALGGGDAEVGIRLVLALAGPSWGAGRVWLGFWALRSYSGESQKWLEQVGRSSAAEPSVQAWALLGAGRFAEEQGQLARATALDEEALVRFREQGDQLGITRALAALGENAWNLGEYARASALLTENLARARELGDREGVAATLHSLGNVVREQGDSVRAIALFEESLAIWREFGDNIGTFRVVNGLGDVYFNMGNYARAAAQYQEALTLCRAGGDEDSIPVVLCNLGRVAHAQGNDVRARALLEESLAFLRAHTSHWGLFWTLSELGNVAHAQGDDAEARELMRESLRVHQQVGTKWNMAQSLERFAGLAVAQGRPERAARLFGAAEALRIALGAPLPPGERADYERDVAAARAQLDEATLAAAWAEGRAMSLEQSIAEALEGD